MGLAASAAPAASFVVYNGDGAGEGLNDGTAVAVVGGNPATNLGAQRQNAIERAVEIWAELLGSPVPIEINAAFDPLPCDSQSAVLASAGPATVHRDFSGAPATGTWYPQAIANRFARADLDPGNVDLTITFNSSLDSACAPGLEFYYGLDAGGPLGAVDMVSVALHEIAHGLGFLSLVDPASGATFLGFPDAYTKLLEQHSTGLTHDALSASQRAIAIRSGSDLHFIGDRTRAGAVAKSAGVDAGDHVRMYAPNPAEPGSSVSHFAVELLSDELMEPSYTGANHDVGLALALLEDVGWLDRCGDGQLDPGELCDDESGCCSETCGPVQAGTPCDDGDSCTLGDLCGSNGDCVAGPGPDCDDLDPCTLDSCDAGGDCTHTALGDGTPCEDGDACSTLDQCQAGSCVPGPPLLCSDGNDCTLDSCEPASGCVFSALSADCDDGDACTWGDKCQNGVCSGSVLLCDDGEDCTIDLCDSASGCTFTPRSGSCDDGNACTSGEVCVGGICSAGSPVNCDDGSVCTDEVCLAGLGCVYSNVSGSCNDGSVCTSDDSCSGGACVGTPLDCSDANVCTDDLCDAFLGCSNPANAAACDDGNPCTSGDVCSEGACISGPAPDCDDGNSCTDDSCALDLGCLHEPNADLCDDGLACTSSDVCDASVCAGGWDDQACALDWQLLYKARLEPGSVDERQDGLLVSDPLVSDAVRTKGPRALALSGSAVGETPRVPELGLVCRKAKGLASVSPASATLSAQSVFGAFSFAVKKAVTLCEPAAVATMGADPAPLPEHSRDAYRCYKVRTLAGLDLRGVVANVADELGAHTLRLTRVREVCAPAGLGGAGPFDANSWLLCAQGKPLVREPSYEVAANQTRRALLLDLLRPERFCVPATVTFP